MSIVQKCKLKQAILTQENAVGGEEKDAYCLSFPYREIGEFGRRAGGNHADARRPNEWLRKRISDQVLRNSLEWKHWGKFLNMGEYSIFKAANSKDGSLTLIQGSIKVSNEFGNFSADDESIQRGKTPYFLKISKIRESIYISEGVCSLREYKERRNTLYKSGYAESLVRKETHRLSALEELEAAGQFFWDLVFATSARGSISIEMAASQVSLNYMISLELLPKPLLPGLSHPRQ